MSRRRRQGRGEPTVPTDGAGSAESGEDRADDVGLLNSVLRDELAELTDGLAVLRQQLSDANGIAGTSTELLSELKDTATALVAERATLERQKAVLVTREHAVSVAEVERDEGYAEERAQLDRDLDALHSSRVAEISEAVVLERGRLQSEIVTERADWQVANAERRAHLERQQVEVERQKGAVSALERELEGRRVELDANELDLERRSDRVRRQAQRRSENIDSEVAERVAEERKSFESNLGNAFSEAERLRQAITAQSDLLAAYKLLDQQLGGREPAAVISELKSLNEELVRQREELAARPTEEVRIRLKAQERKEGTMQSRIDDLEEQVRQKEGLAAKSNEFKLKNKILEAENLSLEQKAKIYEARAIDALAELNRLRAANERPEEIEARYQEIELPRIEFTDVSTESARDISEAAWLEGIGAQCDAYGLHFNPRILKAFHTALKTAEWSPLTVLAGVSGTGKSELPRLYSHFGGMYFEPLSVQPNWDSQESMLGFFNSIDNRFDAQPVLRFLAQSQKTWMPATDEDNGYPGLDNAMCLVLLDEMNLAHPELYFAEFLSKLELRRGKKRSEVPTLPVKIGAGMKPYDLRLGRNVLWAGTMNQDETTKSLSDKVLDRSIIIHFPRPTSLKRRQRLEPLDAKNRGANLPFTTWQSWLARESAFTEEDVRPYKTFVEDMNASLAVAGRALGHRVWQSIEFYMANHPDVRAAEGDEARRAQAMHRAFEDQLVQKVMPKLRGIDTRGKSKTECLDKIKGQLNAGIGGRGFNLGNDFDLATDLGYGQFIWQSANYLQVDSSDEPS